MKKIYHTPDVRYLNLLGEDLLITASNTQAATDADALSRQSGGNSGSFWDDSE